MIKNPASGEPASRLHPCRHFGECGGCFLGMEQGESYEDWKLRLVREALAAKGLRTEPDKPVLSGLGQRRRAVLSARRTKKTIQLGYFRRAGHELVNIEQCPVLAPEIESLLPALRHLLRPVLSRRSLARLTILATSAGPDVLINDCKGVDDPARREEMVACARNMGLARLSINDEVFIELVTPCIRPGDIDVSPPPGAFVQAVGSIERKMIKKVLSFLPASRQRVLDLFCGLGTFSLPLARNHEVTAIENDPALLAALEQAAARSGEISPPTTLRRDLFAMPLSVRELAGFDAALFDPPRGGAISQARQMAGSSLACIIAVSCNPESFANDARILLDGGYDMVSLIPFDQFVFSPHIELVALFVRK